MYVEELPWDINFLEGSRKVIFAFHGNCSVFIIVSKACEADCMYKLHLIGDTTT